MNRRRRKWFICMAAAAAVVVLAAVLAAAAGADACPECGSYDMTEVGGTDAATCLEAWWIRFQCSDCGKTWVREIEPVLKHKLSAGSVLREATCTEAGVRERICTRGCGYTQPEDIPPVPHELVSCPERSGSCEQPGQKAHFACGVCGGLFLDSDAGTAADALDLVLAASGHTWKTEVTEASCTNGGYSTRTCTVCGQAGGRTDETDPAPHDLTKVSGSPASCTEAGTRDLYTCSICGGVFLDDEGSVPADTYSTNIPAFGHDLRRTAGAAPSCTAGGTAEHWTCVVCGRMFADEDASGELTDAVLSAAGHRLEFVHGKDAACETDGSREHFQCTECGLLFRDDTGTAAMLFAETRIEALGHDLTLYPEKKAGEDEDGWSMHWRCERCGRLFADAGGRDEVRPEDVFIAAAGHDISKVQGRSATCTEDGIEAHYACTGCGAVFQDERGEHPVTVQSLRIPAAGHLEEPEAVEPSCTAKGYTRFTCTVCGSVRTALPVEASGHELVHVVQVEPTETEQGVAAHWKCTRCGEIFRDSGGRTEITDADDLVLEPTGHSYETSVVPPTCIEPGRTEHTCTVCGDAFTDSEVPAKGHTLTHVKRVDPEETKDGVREHWLCEECGMRFGDGRAESELSDVRIPAAGHTFSDIIVPATCTEQGYTEHVCETCGETVRDTETEPLGHSLEHLPEVPATEGEEGMREHWKCAACGALFEDGDGTVPVEDAQTLRLDALGHNYKDMAVSADCTRPGYTEHVCTDCGRTYTDEETPALGHLMTRFPAQAPTLSREGNIEYWKCERCGRYYADAQGSEEISAESVVRARLEKDPGGGAVATGDTKDPYAYLIVTGIAAGTCLLTLYLGRRRRSR